ncbi:MAG: NAAT family transporter [Magnetospirillum sp. WYHS-4]
METFGDYSRYVVAMLAILDPFSAIPIFLTLTEGQSVPEKRRTARATVSTVFVVLAVAALSGDLVLFLLGTSLDAFRVGGGIVLLLMAVSMLQAEVGPLRHKPEEAAEAGLKQGVGVVPLGIPLLAGPGAISTTIIQVQRDPTPGNLGMVIACIALVCLAIWLALRLAVPIGQRLGVTGINILNRLIGLILAAVAVQIMAVGLKGLFPGLDG